MDIGLPILRGKWGINVSTNGNKTFNFVYDCNVSLANGKKIVSDYNWCHGPKCHTRHTVDRIRGVKGSKVLRTRKITQNTWNKNSVWSHFCSQGCYTDFMHKHWEEQIRLHPRPEALETPIEDPVKETIQSNWGNYSYTQTRIKEVDNNSNPWEHRIWQKEI